MYPCSCISRWSLPQVMMVVRIWSSLHMQSIRRLFNDSEFNHLDRRRPRTWRDTCEKRAVKFRRWLCEFHF